MKYNRSKIMKQAHELKKDMGLTLGEAIKLSWKIARGETIVYEDKKPIMITGEVIEVDEVIEIEIIEQDYEVVVATDCKIIDIEGYTEMKNWQKKENLEKYLKYLGNEYFEVYTTLRSMFDEENGWLINAVEKLQYELSNLSIYQISDVIENLDIFGFITAEYTDQYVAADWGGDMPCTEYTIKGFNNLEVQQIPEECMKIKDSEILKQQVNSYFDNSDIYKYYRKEIMKNLKKLLKMQYVTNTLRTEHCVY